MSVSIAYSSVSLNIHEIFSYEPCMLVIPLQFAQLSMEPADSDTEKERRPSGKPDNTDPDPASHLPFESSSSEEEEGDDQPCVFRPFTEQSIRNITKRIEREQRRAKKKEQDAVVTGAGGTGTGGGGGGGGGGGRGGDKQNASEEEKEIPNPLYEVGKTLPPRVGDFPPSLYGTPIEDLDRFYRNKYVSIIIIISFNVCDPTSHNIAHHHSASPNISASPNNHEASGIQACYYGLDWAVPPTAIIPLGFRQPCTRSRYFQF